MTRFLTRTAVTKDEAIAYLLRLVDGPVEFKSTDPGCSEELQDEIDSLVFSIQEELEERLDAALEAYGLAKEGKYSEEALTAVKAQVDLAKRYIKLANDVRIALDHELLAPTPVLRIDTNLSASGLLYITLESVRLWAQSNTRMATVQLALTGISAQGKSAEQLHNDRSDPWWQADPRDPEAKSEWYIPARYFARLLVREDPSLRGKRPILVKKIQAKLSEVQVYKRGGKTLPSLGSITNALANVNFLD